MMDTLHEDLVACRNHVDLKGWAHCRNGIWSYELSLESSCIGLSPDRLGLSNTRADAVFRCLIDTAGAANAQGLYAWNDDPSRTKAEVLALLDEAIAATSPPPLDLDLSELVEASLA